MTMRQLVAKVAQLEAQMAEAHAAIVALAEALRRKVEHDDNR